MALVLQIFITMSMTRRKRIIHGSKLREVLREQLRHALAVEQVQVTEDTEFYLVNLLDTYHVKGRLPEIVEDGKPLGVQFLEAMSQDVQVKAQMLKAIGDTTLLVLGFFAEKVRRSIMHTDYYLSLGGSAYHALSDMEVSDPLFSAIYEELAIHFSSIVKAISRMAPWNHASSNQELVMIYRRWLESGDERLQKLLHREGIATHKS